MATFKSVNLNYELNQQGLEIYQIISIANFLAISQTSGYVGLPSWSGGEILNGYRFHLLR